LIVALHHALSRNAVSQSHPDDKTYLTPPATTAHAGHTHLDKILTDTSKLSL
jgi:hypothetical protein